jgi:hypothetical protein
MLGLDVAGQGIAEVLAFGTKDRRIFSIAASWSSSSQICRSQFPLYVFILNPAVG